MHLTKRKNESQYRVIIKVDTVIDRVQQDQLEDQDLQDKEDLEDSPANVVLWVLL